VSITAAKGFVAGGTACGIKASGDPDLAIVATSDGTPVTAAGVFTSNKATAAPVQVSRSHLATTGGQAAAVVINSGNANAATGAPGRADSERTCALVADAVGCAPDAVLVCSTGLIGFTLPMDRIESGVAALKGALTAEGGEAAAQAMLTTDTHRKQVVIEGGGFTVGGMAKGAAMLAPNMATMLAVLTTDAEAAPAQLTAALQAAVAGSFNALSVDGCTSTNDSVLVLASGAAGPVDEAALADALAAACADLARQMAGDAEGATKVITVEVTGAASVGDAQIAARGVAESQLVKCSFYGEDPYWGRVVSELGSCGVAFDPDLVTIAYGDTTVCHDGVAVDHDTAAVAQHLARRNVTVTADLGLGDGRGVILTNDLTHAYIDENMTTS
jgi:glutamate N-acetyltransferase/amino-acid N-acetyltransferase